jgi:hypothetical protein
MLVVKSIFMFCIVIAVAAVFISSTVPVTADIGIKSPGPGLHVDAYALDNSSGGSDNTAMWNFSVYDPGGPLDNVMLSLNSTDPYYAPNNTILYNYSFSENDFHLSREEKKNVTLTMTIKYNTTMGNYNLKIDGKGLTEVLENTTAYSVCYVNVTEKVIPAPTVLQPNGGEVLPGGSSYDIKWSISGGNLTANPITIYYSTNNGSSWTLIKTNEENDGIYSWGVPNIDASNCLVKVEAEDEYGNTGSDTTDLIFTIAYTSPPPPPAPPVPVPEYNMIGLLALIGILSVVLATVMMRRK